MTNPLDWGRGNRSRIATRDFPREVIALVEDRQGGRFCEACRAQGLSTPVGEPLELDHRQPLSQGGDNHWTNLVWLCRSCNRGKGARASCPSTPRWARGPRNSQRR